MLSTVRTIIYTITVCRLRIIMTFYDSNRQQQTIIEVPLVIGKPYFLSLYQVEIHQYKRCVMFVLSPNAHIDPLGPMSAND